MARGARMSSVDERKWAFSMPLRAIAFALAWVGLLLVPLQGASAANASGFESRVPCRTESCNRGRRHRPLACYRTSFARQAGRTAGDTPSLRRERKHTFANSSAYIAAKSKIQETQLTSANCSQAAKQPSTAHC